MGNDKQKGFFSRLFNAGDFSGQGSFSAPRGFGYFSVLTRVSRTCF
jgi:hypothetical protein